MPTLEETIECAEQLSAVLVGKNLEIGMMQKLLETSRQVEELRKKQKDRLKQDIVC
jgi:hypothetical protein